MRAKTSPRRLKAAENRAHVLQLRKAGYSFARIAELIGVSAGYACKIASAAMDEFRIRSSADVEDLVALQLARLDGLLTAVMPKAIAGNLGAVDRVLKVEERRAKLLGLDAPSKFAPTDPSGIKSFEGGGLAALLAEIKDGGAQFPT